MLAKAWLENSEQRARTVIIHALKTFSFCQVLRIELVACSADRKDDFRVCLVVFQLASQIHDVVVNRTGGRHVFGGIAPEVL